MLGSVSDAQDAVQEAWLRYIATPTLPMSTKAFLSVVVTRITIDVLRSARVRRETYLGGSAFPEPLMVDPYDDPESAAELGDTVSMAALMMLERLSPLERACLSCVRCSHSDFRKSRWPWDAPSRRADSSPVEPAAICSRAGLALRRIPEHGRSSAARFRDAFRNGSIPALREFLTADIRASRGRGKSPQYHPMIGSDPVVQWLARMVTPRCRWGILMEPVRSGLIT